MKFRAHRHFPVPLTSGVDSVGDDRLEDCVGDGVGVLLVPQVVQHVDGRVQHGEGIREVLAGDGRSGVASSRFEDGVMFAVVPAGQQAGPADEPADDVGRDGSVQVGGQQHIELVRVGHELHAGVVDDHVVVLDVGILLGDPAGRLEEAAVRNLHDVGLVNGRDLLASVAARVLEGVAGESFGGLDGDDFHRLDDALHALVLQHGVLALGVLTDHHQVDVLMVRADTRVRLAVQHADEQIELISDRDVPRGDAGLQRLRLDVALDGDAVPLDGVDGVVEIFVRLAVRVNVDDLEVDGHSGVAEDLTDVVHQLAADATARQHRHRVSPSVLRLRDLRHLLAQRVLVLHFVGRAEILKRANLM